MSGAKKSDILSFELKKVGRADIKKIGELVTKAKGDRTAKDFAKTCGVSTSTMTRLMLGTNATPSSDDLIVQVAKNADLTSGVTFRMLVNAQGYALPNEDEMSPDELDYNYEVTFQMVLVKIIENEKSSVEKITEPVKSGPDTNVNKAPVYERKAMLIIQKALFEKGFMVGRCPDKIRINGRNFFIIMDFAFVTNALEEENLQRWAFDVKVTSELFIQHSIDRLFSAAYMDSPLKKGTRLTLAVCNERSFNVLKDSLKNVAIPDSISIMYIDLINERVVEEFVIPRTDGVRSVCLFEKDT